MKHTRLAATPGSLKRIVILGGGTAGWLTACHLGAKVTENPHLEIEIVLLESPDIPTIGVGEGTVPSIVDSLSKIGIRETDLIKHADATFKQSVQFIDWKKNTNGSLHKYHHVFDYLTADKEPLIQKWAHNTQIASAFVDCVSSQGLVCDQSLAPKLITTPEYRGLTGYAYHFDAIKLAGLLTEHATSRLGVRHVKAELVEVEQHIDGSIAALLTDAGQRLDGELFVDCSGFACVLLGKNQGVKFLDKSHILFANKALTAQISYPDLETSLPSSTLATAQQAGWIWDIALSNRRGTGYAYSDKHTHKAEAEQVFNAYLKRTCGDLSDNVTVREVSFKVGYRQRAWHKNCVAIGLSQGFVEPLEATGILMIDDAGKALCELLPDNLQQMATAAKKFNRIVTCQWDCIIDFIKLHYYLSDRDDSDFWQDNRLIESVPESLLEKLALWQTRIPSEYDFSSRHEVFYRMNYLYILYGMGIRPQTAARCVSHSLQKNLNKAEKILAHHQQSLLDKMRPNRELISRIKQHGLQRV